MNLDFADQIMAKFRITILDLIRDEEMWNSFDDKNPDWLTQAAKRKPAMQSSERQRDSQTPRRTGS